MTRRKLTTLIVAGVFAAALLGVALLKRSEPAVPTTPVAEEEGAKQPEQTTPAQIQEVPRSTQDVFMPPPTDAIGSAPAPRNERSKSFLLLLALFSVADRQRRERNFDPAKHWWHRDLADAQVVTDILARNGAP